MYMNECIYIYIYVYIYIYFIFLSVVYYFLQCVVNILKTTFSEHFKFLGTVTVSESLREWLCVDEKKIRVKYTGFINDFLFKC